MIFLSHSVQRDILKQVYSALQERGYNPAGQLVGYILSEDPTYITAHNGARKIVTRIDRNKALEEIVESYFSVFANGDSVAPD